MIWILLATALAIGLLPLGVFLIINAEQWETVALGIITIVFGVLGTKHSIGYWK